MSRYQSAAAVVLALVILVAAGQEPEDTVKDKAVCEEDADQCLSAPTSFKCAMMFKNLTNLPLLKVLDIIPDLINHDPTPEVKEELVKKDINFAAFKIADVCPGPAAADETQEDKLQRLKQFRSAEKRANARCYAFLNEYTTRKIDSCDTGLIAGDDSDTETVGDVLCERAHALYNFDPAKPKFWYVALAEIGAYVSYCGRKWQEVQTGGKHLVIQQKLCCVRRCRESEEGGKCEDGQGVWPIKYQPCNGSRQFNKNCDRRRKK